MAGIRFAQAPVKHFASVLLLFCFLSAGTAFLLSFKPGSSPSAALFCLGPRMQVHVLLSALVIPWLIHTSNAAGRVVQLITENPSAFVAADPNDPQHIVTLFDEDNQPSELPQAGMLRHMLMTDAAGQRYNCSIPESPSQFSSGIAAQASQQAAAVATRTPYELLDSLTGLCLYRQDGLWTYEVCHKKHVRQFRQAQLPSEGVTMIEVSDTVSLSSLMHAVEAGDTQKAFKELGKLLGGDAADTAKGKEDFSCGQYSGDDVQTEAILEDASSSGHHIKYVSHVFSGGADCVLTEAPRTAEVRYTCARDAKENVVLSVKEFPSCNYVVVVSTPFLCKHPVFVPPVPDVRVISCLPIDEAGQAAIKELKALASAPKATTDSSDVTADAVQTPRIAAASPAAAATDSSTPSLGAAAAAGSQTSRDGQSAGTTAGKSSSTAAGSSGEAKQYSSHPSGHSQPGKQQIPRHIEVDIEEEEEEEDSDRDEL